MSFWVLDTDTLTLLQHNHPVVSAHAAQHTPQELGTTVITVEEQLTGWYRELRKARTPKQVARAYRRLAESVTTLSGLPILTFSENDIQRYQQLSALKMNIRKMDLRIAAIVLEHGAVLVTRNVRDFQRVPNLTIEDWSQ